MQSDINKPTATQETVTEIHFHTNGNIQFEGEVNVVTNQKEGFGQVYYENGNKLYIGEFNCNKKEGQGKYYYDETGNVMFDGELKNDLRNGKGVSYHPNGQKSYEGKFKDDMTHGFGLQYGPKGDLKYRGYFIKNLKHGRWGQYYYYNKSIMYNGTWEDDKKDGKGVLNSFEGTKIYEGDFKKDFKHGKGVEYNKITTQKSYEGKWLKDKKDGEGTYYGHSINTSCIKAIWKEDLLSDIISFEHKYQNSLRNQDFSTIDLDDYIYYGETEGESEDTNKVANGFGLYIKKDNCQQKSEGFYENGKLNGFGKEYCIDKQISEITYMGNWSKGKRSGFGMNFKPNGKIDFQGTWKYGFTKVNGITYDKDGCITKIQF